MLFISFVVLLFSGACKQVQPLDTVETVAETLSLPDTTISLDFDSTKWTELTHDDGFLLDIRYATKDNFVGEVIYPCGRCFVKPEVAQRLRVMSARLREMGLQFKMFDCYRPGPAQQRLWAKVPDPRYVADPAEGSMHNRGIALDLTLVRLDGTELDMGTTYDYFGKEAYHDYTEHSAEIAANRQLLKSTMEKEGFQSIRTEWWHYSYRHLFPPIEKWEWPCP